jgi:hypothetical protein
MKQLFFLLVLFCLSTLLAVAQNEDKTVTLDEVIVKAPKVVSKADGQTIFPTVAQKNASNNGYALIQKLSLPNLRIDGAAHSITAIDGRGKVQLRINGIIVGKEEMLALDPKLINKIDYIDKPGVRYGEDVAYVINIITKRKDSGYTLGADVTPTLTSWQGDGTVYGKWNHKKSEFTVSYDYSGYKLNGTKVTELAEYTLNNGDIHTIERDDVETLRKAHSHDMKLTYNLADSSAYVFQASLSESLNKNPGNYSIKNIIDGTNRYSSTNRENGKSSSPVLDLYFFRQLTPQQSITANAVGTYIATKSSNYYDEGAPYQYDVDGKTVSALSEIVYENRLNPFTLSAGVNYRYKYTKNDYTGDAFALTELNQNNIYAFSELKGSFKDLRYSIGLGASYIHYNQNEHSYDFCTFRPKATLAYDIMNGMQLSYTFEMKERASRIAMISDATIQTNSMEFTVGNPDLKPSRNAEHALRLSYNDDRWSAFAEGFYRHCNKPNMAHYERTDDDKFIYTQINQKAINVLNTMAYASYWITPEKLQIYANGGMMRCFNYGFDYTHCYTSWFYSAGVTAYLGKFTLLAFADNGFRFLEGETKGYSGAYTTLQCSYNYGDWQFSLSWSNPFINNYKSAESEILNRNFYKHFVQYNRDSGNSVSLNVSWRLSRGRKHQSVDKTINLRDSDNGIITR